MFVLPPQSPSRYPSTTATLDAVLANGVAAPMTETHNVLSHPTGADCQLLAGEGTYILRDELHLATPPPHPSEAPQSVQTTNPLASISTPTAGTKLSLVVLTQRKSPALLYKINTARAGGTYRIEERAERFSDVSAETTASPSTDDSGLGPQNRLPSFGEGNASLLIFAGKDKRRKPKNSIQKSNSSYISRVILNESLSKWLQERNADGILAFANVNRAFEWLDLSSDTRKADYLTKILFTKGHALCHDVNTTTKSPSHLDVIIGCSTGDIIWYEPISQKYGRINKNGLINSSSVVDIRWIPGSENLFLAAHSDGSFIVYDKEKEDAMLTAEESRPVPVDSPMSTVLHIEKSVNSSNQKFNPVSSWKLPCQNVTAFAISPDNQHLAVVSEDGDLRIIDFLKERLLDLYTSYYGGLTCVCWSPDGKILCSGGQDDTISIWSLTERRILARCQGHHSWVTSVAFDPWRCDEHNYRFGSVGEDCRLLLWDFNVGMLHRPKAASVRQRGSISSHVPLSLSNRYRTDSLTSRFRSSSIFTTESVDGENLIVHPLEPRANTAVLPPVVSKIIDTDPLCWLGFEEDCIITSSVSGNIRTWDRPKESANDSQVTLSASGSNT